MALANKGHAFFHLDRFSEALACIDKALELNPEYAPAYRNVSEIYIITKNYVGAYEMAERALTIAKESDDIIMSLFLTICSFLFQNKHEDAKSKLNGLIDYLEAIKDWSLKEYFSDIKQAIESSDVDKNAKSLMLSLIELLEKRITLDVFKKNFFGS